MADLAHELQKIYDDEINVRISWFWDNGIEIRLGDEMNGYLAEENVPTVAEIVPWMQEAIAHFYPESPYAASLSSEIRERAASRLFRPPKIGARVICPHCGAPNSAPEMDELFAFVCTHCGESVEVQPLKVQCPPTEARFNSRAFFLARRAIPKSPFKAQASVCGSKVLRRADSAFHNLHVLVGTNWGKLTSDGRNWSSMGTNRANLPP
jgi:hypothetical protein